ncbi:MAG: H-type lectin domain-containing protein [Pseudomonadota bacterium]
MKFISSSMIGIEQGDDVLFSDFEDEGDMWTGKGPRERRRAVAFSRSFLQPPSIFVALSMWDIDSGSNARADVSAEKATPKGFDIVFKTWGDTRVARARVRWMAIGPVVNDDDWELY